jgi:hypothetical protein
VTGAAAVVIEKEETKYFCKGWHKLTFHLTPTNITNLIEETSRPRIR